MSKEPQWNFRESLRDFIGSDNFLKKLWRGDYPLWKTCWIFGIVYPFSVWIIFGVFFFLQMAGAMSDMEDALPQGSTPQEVERFMLMKMKNTWKVMLGLISIYYVYAFIWVVGLWRSASVYMGASKWRVLIKIWVVFYFIALPFNIYVFIVAIVDINKW